MKSCFYFYVDLIMYKRIFRSLILLLIVGNTAFAQQVSVYPGDVNNDGLVNALDFVHIGFKYDLSTIRRQDTLTNFSPYTATLDNSDSLNIPKNVVFADCDGNGIVLNEDIYVIDSNFGSRRQQVNPLPTSSNTPQGIPLQIVSLNNTIVEGGFIDFDIKLGTATNQVSRFRGIAFSLVYDTTLVRVQMSPLTSADNFWTQTTNILKLTNTNYIRNRHYVFSSILQGFKTNNNIVSIQSSGTVFHGRAIWEENVLSRMRQRGLNTISIQFSDVYLVDDTGNAIPVNLQNTEFIISLAPKIYPNPTNKMMYIQNIQAEKYEIYNAEGKIVSEQILNANELYQTIDVANLPKGIYVLRLKQKDKNTSTKFVKN